MKGRKGCRMNALLMNRDGFQMPADGWYQVAPLGEFAHAQAGVVQVVDAEACTAMANRFQEESNGANFAGLLMDFDHFSLDGEKRSEAAGWITALENRDGGLFAKIRWSDVGEEAVKGGRYRFLSPVWNRADCVDLGGGRVRPVRLLNAAVTNDPNLKGMQPLSNNAAAAGEPRFKWVLGDTPEGRHCPSCSAVAGQVHTMAEWDAAKVKPGADGLCCQGNCKCRLDPTTDAASAALTNVPLRKVQNAARSAQSGEGFATGTDAKGRDGNALANVGWTDEARNASLEVRRAKARLRGTRHDWGWFRQQESMRKAELDYEGIFKEKGYSGMTPEEKRYLSARISVKVRNGTPLTDAEKRYLRESQGAGAPRTLATTNREIRAAKERVRASLRR